MRERPQQTKVDPEQWVRSVSDNPVLVASFRAWVEGASRICDDQMRSAVLAGNLQNAARAAGSREMVQHMLTYIDQQAANPGSAV